MQCVYCTAANLGRQHANGDRRDRARRGGAHRGRRARARRRARADLLRGRRVQPAGRAPSDRCARRAPRPRARRSTSAGARTSTRLRSPPSSQSSCARRTGTSRSRSTARPTRCSRPPRSRSGGGTSTRSSRSSASTESRPTSGSSSGCPGETEETIAETIGFVRSLPESIEVVYSAGARVYPHTPLARIAEQEPERLVGADDPTFLTPVVYSRPWPPRELARRLDAQLRELPNVSRVGVAYATGQTTLSDAYRASRLCNRLLRSRMGAAWDEILERAAHDDTQRKPGRDDRRLSAGRPLARALRPRVVRGSAAAPRRDPAGDVASAAPLRPPRVRRHRAGGSR